jgi:hypothetical protein
MNRETYPAAQSPLTGDISGPASAQTVTVVGLQTNSVASGLPSEQARLTWSAVTQEWVPQVPSNMSILLNGFISGGNLIGFIDISDDYDFLVNHVGLEVLVNWTLGFSFNVYVNEMGVA